MAAPISPTTAELAHRGEPELFALLVEQARRVETALGGTAPVSPSIAQLSRQGTNATLAELIYQLRRIEDAS